MRSMMFLTSICKSIGFSALAASSLTRFFSLGEAHLDAADITRLIWTDCVRKMDATNAAYR